MKTSSDFLAQLRSELQHLSPAEREDILAEISTHIEDGVDDPNLNMQLGDPIVLAEQMQSQQWKMRLKSIFWFILPIIWIFAATIGYGISENRGLGSFLDKLLGIESSLVSGSLILLWGIIKILGLGLGALWMRKTKQTRLLQNWWFSGFLYYIFSYIHSYGLEFEETHLGLDQGIITTIGLSIILLVMSFRTSKKWAHQQSDGFMSILGFMPLFLFLPSEFLRQEDVWTSAFLWGGDFMFPLTFATFSIWGFSAFGVSNRSKQWLYFILGLMLFSMGTIVKWWPPLWLVMLSLQGICLPLIVGLWLDYHNGRLRAPSPLKEIAS
jgi:hypothetical protein